MRVVEFYLINEKGHEFSFMDEANYCLLSGINGLGYSYNTTYEQLGDYFMPNLRKFEQGTINCELKFKNYDNFQKFINFIESAEKLRFLYKIPFSNKEKKEYYKDIEIRSVSKGRIVEDDEKLIENVSIECLSLWYEQNETVYDISKKDREMRWNFRWNSRFTSYNNRTVIFENKGHTEAPFSIEADGYLLNPTVSIFVEGKKVNELKLDITIQKYEKLLYCTKDTELFIIKQNTDGTKENLFNSLNINNNNFFKIPKGVSEIRITADNEVSSAKLSIYVEYKVV